MIIFIVLINLYAIAPPSEILRKTIKVPDTCYFKKQKRTNNMQFFNLKRREKGLTQDPIVILRKTVREEKYNNQRMLSRYELAFGFKTEEIVKHLLQGKSWFDSGAGKCNAVLGALKKFNEADITALTLDKLPDHNKNQLQCFSGFRLIQKEIEKLSVEEVLKGRKEKFDLITDYYGAFSYTFDISTVLYLYGKIIKVGGSIYMIFNQDSASIDEFKRKREIDSLLEYIKLYSHLLVMDVKVSGQASLGKHSLRALEVITIKIQKLYEPYGHSFMPLKIIHTTEGGTPKRRFIFQEPYRQKLNSQKKRAGLKLMVCCLGKWREKRRVRLEKEVRKIQLQEIGSFKNYHHYA